MTGSAGVRLLWLYRVLLVCILALPVQSEAQQIGIPRSQILTVSTDRLFAESLYGLRIADEIDAESAVLAAENERIVAELSREEKDLTERRAEIEPEAFRALADAFDRKVQEHRSNQNSKLEALANRSDRAQSSFFEIARPVLEGLMRETGASIMLERSSVLFSANATDITDIAISRIDAAIGDGASLEGDGDR